MPKVKKISDKTISSYHIFPILLPKHCNRIAVMEYLKSKGIQTSIHYPSFKDFTYYAAYCTYALEHADEVSSRVLTLPLYPDLSFEMIEKIVNDLNESLQ